MINIISSRKADMNETQNNAKRSARYAYGDIEITDFVGQATVQCPPQLVFAIDSIIKYLSRASLGNGHEDLAKAGFYADRVLDLWGG